MLRIAYILTFMLFSVLTLSAENRGIPFMHNYLATEYGAHNRNFDVACDDYGCVYFANFECLLYYDGTSWRKIYSPGINRFSRLVWEKHRQRILVGGFHFFGYLEADKLGRLHLKIIHSNIGEVDKIELRGKNVFVHDTDNHVFFLDGLKKLVPYRGDTSFIDTDMNNVAFGYTRGINIQWVKDKGIEISDAKRHTLLTEEDGLCSNSINFIMYDRRHTVWGATDEGIFAIEIPSPYSQLTRSQGLHGEVYSINELNGILYVGTLQGLYRIDKGKVSKIPSINCACWQLTTDKINTHRSVINRRPSANGVSLLAATSKGLFRITDNDVQQIDSDYVLSAIPAPHGGVYTGTQDGVYYTRPNNTWVTVSTLVQKGGKLWLTDNTLHVETINGQVYNISLSPSYKAVCIRPNIDVNEPRVKFTDAFGGIWETDAVGAKLSVHATDNKSHLRFYEKTNTWIHPFKTRILNAIFCGRDNSLWVGGDFGIINCDLSLIRKNYKNIQAEPVYIRQITIKEDSVVWGGFTNDNGYKPVSHYVIKESLPSDCHRMAIYFSSRYMSFVSPTQYRYRLKRGFDWGNWSQWSTETKEQFNNMISGDYVMEIQAMDLFGNISTASVTWSVDYPFYLRWWAFTIYIFVLMVIGRLVTRYRMKRLERDKARLEKAVNEATAEISQQNAVLSQQKDELSQQKEELSQQKDELSKRSIELAFTLNQLKKTQADLVRAERSATAGKLTQGLIDRILNPLNYILNFSKLTSGLAKDLSDDIEEEKESMSKDGFEDCEDILDMMHQNLTKIEEHGINTTRTLRSMEAILNHKTGTLRLTDLSVLCQQALQVTSEYYKDVLTKWNINVTSNIEEEVSHNVDPEAISNVLKAILGNAIYAVEKRLTHEPCDNPGVSLSLVSRNSPQFPRERETEESIIITIHDTGIGIENSILDKVFDPFFTTKPTSEASGVGLYLAREIVQDHKGTITVNSEKNNFTDIIITF